MGGWGGVFEVDQVWTECKREGGWGGGLSSLSSQLTESELDRLSVCRHAEKRSAPGPVVCLSFFFFGVVV